LWAAVVLPVIFGVLVAGFSKSSNPPSAIANQSARPVNPAPVPSTTKWSGSGPDCSPDGHYDQTVRGEVVSSAYSDECDGATPTLPAKVAPPCTEFKDPTTGEIIKNGPVGNCVMVPPPPPAELAKLHREWIKMRPSATYLAQQAQTERRWQIFNETAKRARWVNAAVPLMDAKLDEFYELPGEDGNNACAEVILAPNSGYNTYTVVIFAPDGERDIKAITKHLAEETAILACGRGFHPQ